MEDIKFTIPDYYVEIQTRVLTTKDGDNTLYEWQRRNIKRKIVGGYVCGDSGWETSSIATITHIPKRKGIVEKIVDFLFNNKRSD